MGRGAGCCNFKYTVNCTAPPCPEGTCCYVNKNLNASHSLSINESVRRYICEDDVTENCCLAKDHSFFTKKNAKKFSKNCSEIFSKKKSENFDFFP